MRLVSDEVRADAQWPEKITNGLISHPMNVMPEPEHIYHSHRTVAYVEQAKRAGYGADAFGSDSYPIEDWGRRVLNQAQAIEATDEVVTILAHPVVSINSSVLPTGSAWL